MTDHATLFERAWSGRESGEPLSWGDGEVEPVLAELRLADGLQDTGDSVVQPDWEAAWDELVVRLAEPSVPVGLDVRRREPLARARLARAGVALAAALSLILGAAMVSAGASPGSLLYPVRKAVERGVLAISPSDRALLVRIADARLEDLLIALRDRRFDLVAGLASDLVRSRQAALDAGGDVTTLDRAIAGRVPPALAGAPAGFRETVEGILGDLLPAGSLEQDPGNGASGEPAIVPETPAPSAPKNEESGGGEDEESTGAGGNERPEGAGRDDEAEATGGAGDEEPEATSGAGEDEAEGSGGEEDPEASGGAGEDEAEGSGGGEEPEGTAGGDEDDEPEGTGGTEDDEPEGTAGPGDGDPEDAGEDEDSGATGGGGGEDPEDTGRAGGGDDDEDEEEPEDGKGSGDEESDSDSQGDEESEGGEEDD